MRKNVTKKVASQVEQLDAVLQKQHYKKNTRSLYLWQAEKFLQHMQEMKPTTTQVDNVAARYLKKINKEHSRSYFLQACSVVNLICDHIFEKPLPSSFFRRIQTSDANSKR